MMTELSHLIGKGDLGKPGEEFKGVLQGSSNRAV